MPHANISEFVPETLCPEHYHIGAEYIYSYCNLLPVSNWLSIRAADFCPSGSGSSDLDKCIQSQETKVIPTLCSLLALDQQHLVLRGLGSVWCGVSQCCL